MEVVSSQVSNSTIYFFSESFVSEYFSICIYIYISRISESEDSSGWIKLSGLFLAAFLPGVSDRQGRDHSPTAVMFHAKER